MQDENLIIQSEREWNRKIKISNPNLMKMKLIENLYFDRKTKA